jgi:hypothetical protein
MIAFYLSRAAAAGAALRDHRRPRAGYLVALLSAIVFVVTMAATLSFLSPCQQETIQWSPDDWQAPPTPARESCNEPKEKAGTANAGRLVSAPGA